MRDKIKLSWPGPRTIKTAISVAACVILYSFIYRDGVMMAITAAIICLQDSVEKSITLGKCRVIGTLVGGLLGAACLSAGLIKYGDIGIILCSFLGIVAIIHFFHMVKMPQSSVISAIVYMIIITSVLNIASDTEISPVSYSVNRVIDTLIGIMVSVTVNITMFRPVERVENTGAAAPPVYEITAKEYSRVSKWAGGNTTELYIYPEDTFYSDKNFDFRISTATVEMENSAFTKLPGYKRYIMALDGVMSLSHENYHNITLRPFEKDYFLGSWNTSSSGRCADFNLMTAENLSGKIDAISPGHEEKFTTKSFNGFYCLCDGTTVQIQRSTSTKTETLQKGDFIMFRQELSSPEAEYSVIFSNSSETQYIAVMASVYFE